LAGHQPSEHATSGLARAILKKSHAARTQSGDFALVEAPVRERLASAFAALGRRAAELRSRAREARRGRRLRDLGELGVGGARAAMLVRARLRPGKHRRETGVRAVEHAAPLIARFALEGFRQAAAHLWPVITIVLRRQVAELQALAELGKEFVLDGA